MKTAISLFVLVGLCLGTALSAEGQWPLGKELAQTAVKAGESSSSITVTGRYQVFVSPNAKGHTFMIDTDTGRLWIMKKDAVSGNFSMHRIPVEEGEARAAETSSNNPAKGNVTKPESQ
jgi:hypothetical protein